MNVVLGIDGGGTRTRASIVEGERVLAHAESGSIKRLRVGAKVSEENLRALLKEVYAQAGVNGVRAASAGVASASMPGVKEWITAVFQDFGVERVRGRGRRSDRPGCGLPRRAGNPADCRNRLEHHWPRAGRQPGERWRLEFAAGRRGFRLLDRRATVVRWALHAYDREQPTQSS